MAEHTDDFELTRDARMGRAIVRGVAFGLPIAIVFLTFVMFIITDLDLADSFAAALLPGILLGGFAGGFVGVATTMN